MKLIPLTPNELYQAAPAVYADRGGHRTSTNYGFMPTTKVIDVLEQHGWRVHKASQVRSKNYHSTARHMVRMYPTTPGLSTLMEEFNSVPEIIVVNDHNGRSKLQILGGIFRFFCMNGLVVTDADFGSVTVKHLSDAAAVIDGIVKTAHTKFIDLSFKLQDMRQTEMGPELQRVFAESILRYRYGDDFRNAPVTAEQLLEVRRRVDMLTDVWTIMNRVQENIIVGGAKREKRRTYRGIKSLADQQAVNQRLWKQANWILNDSDMQYEAPQGAS